MVGLNLYPSQELEAACKRAGWRGKLTQRDDEELVWIYRVTEEKYRDRKFNSIAIAALPEEVYRAGAAVDVLRERHGDDFVAELTGVPQPKTLAQKVKYFFLERV